MFDEFVVYVTGAVCMFAKFVTLMVTVAVGNIFTNNKQCTKPINNQRTINQQTTNEPTHEKLSYDFPCCCRLPFVIDAIVIDVSIVFVVIVVVLVIVILIVNYDRCMQNVSMTILFVRISNVSEEPKQ